VTHLPRPTDEQRQQVRADLLIATIAAGQHGVISTAQLLSCGLTKDAIYKRVRAGLLHPVLRGVYAVGHPGLTDRGRDMAAVLAGGSGALLSHAFGVALWGWCPRPAGRVHITVPRQRRSRTGVVVHVSGTLLPADRDRRFGIPVTSPARTLVDYADVATPTQLRRALEAAERAELVDRAELELPRPGRRRVVHAPHRFTRSGLERRVLELLREAGLPLPETNQLVLGWEVDCLWREQRAVLEIDALHTHRDPAVFERDRRKQNALEEAGYRVRRVTDTMVRERGEVVRTVARLLGP
jgi:very-short-patch-repair endonuclease